MLRRTYSTRIASSPISALIYRAASSMRFRELNFVCISPCQSVPHYLPYFFLLRFIILKYDRRTMTSNVKEGPFSSFSCYFIVKFSIS